jgi:hypothetical protein
MSNLEPGAWVLGRYRAGDFFFPGVVQHVGNGSVTIGYDDGDRETLPVEMTRPYDWAVGSRIEAIWSGNGQWYEAEIIAAHENGVHLTVRFLDDGIEETTVTARCRERAT